MKGFPVSTDAKIYMKGFSLNSYDRVIEAQEKTPPPGTYLVPEGFSKKDELTMQDLRG